MNSLLSTRQRRASFGSLVCGLLVLGACGARTPLARDSGVGDDIAADSGGGDALQDASADSAADGPRVPGSLEWVKLVGHLGAISAIKVAAHPAGGHVLVGGLSGTARLGGSRLASHGRNDVVVARFDAQGRHVWSRAFGGERDDVANAVAVDGAGRITVVGSFEGGASFGGATLTSRGVRDAFVARFSSAGAHLWSKALGGSSIDVARAVAVDAAGNVTVAGSFRKSASFGGATLTSAGIDEIFIVRLSASGQHVWSRAVGGTGRDTAVGVAVDASGNTVLAGTFERSASFGGAMFTTRGDRSSDVFVARYDAAGQHLWSESFGGTNLDVANALAVDRAGNITIAGAFSSSASFGGATFKSVSLSDGFIAHYSAAGEHLWSRSFGGTYADSATAVAVDGAGNITVAGRFASEASFGGATLSASGGSVFVVRFRASGQHVWSMASSGAGTADADAMAVDAAGTVTLSGASKVTSTSAARRCRATAPRTSSSRAMAPAAAIARRRLSVIPAPRSPPRRCSMGRATWSSQATSRATRPSAGPRWRPLATRTHSWRATPETAATCGPRRSVARVGWSPRRRRRARAVAWSSRGIFAAASASAGRR